MTLDDAMKEHYEAVLKDVTGRLAEHEREVLAHQNAIRELNPMIANLSKTLGVKPPVSTSQRARPVSGSQPYASMSTRWSNPRHP